jgi:photosystem II stability/assembly factor-like uncharacterized protein
MNKIILLCIILIASLLTFSSSIFSQSGWLPSQTGTSYDYYGVYFTDNITGWICGQNGKILKTINGGDSWQQLTSITSNLLRDIHFINSSTGIACGNNGTIVKTITSGLIWGLRPVATASNLNRIFFFNSSTGWIVGDSGTIFKTTNAGDNWFRQQSPVTSGLKSVHFSSVNSGWAVGLVGKILKTTNGGANWVISLDLGTIANLYSVQFLDALTGYIAGEYESPPGTKFVFFYKTVNGGVWWLYKFSGVTTTIRSLYFANPLCGWAVGDSGVILGTSNSGENWVGLPSHTFSNLNDLFFSSPKQGWIAGNNGTVLKTITGGFFDTLYTNRRDLGVIPLIINSSEVINAKYRVMFRAPDTSYNIMRSLNNGQSFDTIISHVSLNDTGRTFDGLMVRVKKIKFSPDNGNFSGNAGVVKDPVASSDSLQTRQCGWDYIPPQNRNLEGGRFIAAGKLRPWQSVSMSLSYPTRLTWTGFRSLLNPEDLRKVKIVFTGYGSGQQAYRYLAVSTVNYQYQDMKEVPFKVYEVDPSDGTPNPRQLNAAFLEFPDGSQNSKWEPTTDSTGGKDVLYIFTSNYDPNPNPFYTAKNLLLNQPQIDVMYAWNAKLINSGPVFHVNDEFTIYPYTVTRPDIAPGYPLYYEFQTYSLIGVQQISNKIPVSFELFQNFPNPFNPKTKIKFSLPKTGFTGGMEVCIKVYDILGREVAVLVNEKLYPGTYETEFEGNNLSSGIYFCRISAGDFSQSKKMVLLK